MMFRIPFQTTLTAALFCANVAHAQIGFPHPGSGGFFDSHELSRQASQLSSSYGELESFALDVSYRADSNNFPGRSDRFRQLSSVANQLSLQFDHLAYEIERSARPDHARRTYEHRIRPQLNYLASIRASILLPDPQVDHRLRAIDHQLMRFEQSLRGAGGFPPRPPRPAVFQGYCRVVLETVFGRDIQDFWGQGVGRTQQDALIMAQRDGQLQCNQANFGGRNRCTIDRSQCYAQLAPIGRPYPRH